MSPKTHQGSCHCGAVKFTTTLDLAENGTVKCNCTRCLKTRTWAVLAKPEDFALTQGEAELTEYGAGKHFPRYFCKICGTNTHMAGMLPQRGQTILLQPNVLDDVDPTEIGDVSVHYINNLENKPMETPEYTGHL